MNKSEDMVFPLWGESPWRSDQWAMVFEASFRADCVIVVVVVFVAWILPIRDPWEILDLFFIQMQLHPNSDIARITMQYELHDVNLC